VGSGRLATLGPALSREFEPNPLLGEGFGTRVVAPTPAVPVANAPILDDEWLGILLETGLAGALTLSWLFIRLIRRLLPEARDNESASSWFMVAVIASVSSFAVSMFFYDAFSFIQVTFMLFIVMGLGTSVLLSTAPSRAVQRARREAESLSRPRLDRPHGQPG
jgi:O-antigen ligase